MGGPSRRKPKDKKPWRVERAISGSAGQFCRVAISVEAFLRARLLFCSFALRAKRVLNMRHRWAGRKLGRTSSHRKALLRNMVMQFLDKERLITTVPKAKELRPFAEKMITLGKRETLHARRHALAVIRSKVVVSKLFDTLGPRFADRSGGYTRILRLGPRKGDGAELALIELIGSEYQPPEAPQKAKKAEKKKEVQEED